MEFSMVGDRRDHRWLYHGQNHERSRYGILHDMVLGLVGAFVGGFITRQLGIGGGGMLYTIVVAVLGAMLVTFIVRKIRGSNS